MEMLGTRPSLQHAAPQTMRTESREGSYSLIKKKGGGEI